MDELDILENVIQFLLLMMPIIGLSARTRITEMIFDKMTGLGLDEYQKGEIFDRVEYTATLFASIASIQGLTFCVLGYFHQSFWGTLAAVILFFAGMAFVLWLWEFGSTGFTALKPLKKYLICAVPALILIIKIIVVLFAKGLDVANPVA